MYLYTLNGEKSTPLSCVVFGIKLQLLYLVFKYYESCNQFSSININLLSLSLIEGQKR